MPVISGNYGLLSHDDLLERLPIYFNKATVNEKTLVPLAFSDATVHTNVAMQGHEVTLFKKDNILSDETTYL
eukprot:2210093-Pleurochrysis_carterae.AAC.1